MTTDAINAPKSPVQQESAPVSEKKSSSMWNNMSVTVKNGCDSTADFFNNMFSSIGNFFKKTGNFLWKNKVTTSVCALISAVILGVSAVFLAIFADKKEVKPVVPPQPKPEQKKVEDVEEDDTDVIVLDLEEDDTDVEEVSTVDELQEPEKETSEAETVAKGERVESIRQQFEAPKSDAEPPVKPQAQPVKSDNGIVERMKQKIKDEKEKSAAKQKQKEKPKTDSSSSHVKQGHKLLAGLNFTPGGRPPAARIPTTPVATSSENTAPKQRNTQELSDIMKGRPTRSGVRRRTRASRAQVTKD